MQTPANGNSASQCWPAPERLASHPIDSLIEGVQAMEPGQVEQRLARLRREAVDHPVIYVGTGSCGRGAGAGRTLDRVRRHLQARKIQAEVVEVGCIGLCAAEPLLDIQLPDRSRVCFQHVTEDKAEALVDAVLAGKIPADGVLGQFRHPLHKPWEGVPFLDEHPFFAPQTRWVMANCGLIQPTSIDEYIARGGYRALAKALGTLTPETVCEMVEKSGLRGRGGAGFPTGVKWKFARQTSAPVKYLVCNADEGDPGAFMNRALMEGDPHRLIEGMALAAFAIGATEAFIYVRAEKPLAGKRVKDAIAQAEACGLLGQNIRNSGFNLRIQVRMGAGAFVCGEETALLQSIEGKRGMPRPRPPFPAVKGLFGRPTVINNVETLANIPGIVARGPEWFSSAGIGTSRGTKIFALSGKVARTGLVEVAIGTTVRRVVLEIGGGCPNDRAFKAVQIGGPSGGCVPASQLDTPIDYDSLRAIGAIMGSGGMVVMDQDTCMVDVAKFFMDFIQRESCGKCTPCREGTRRLLQILQDITTGRPREGLTRPRPELLPRQRVLDYITRLATTTRDTSLCGLGQTAPNPILSTLRWFPEEYQAHVNDYCCPAKACTEMLTYTIDADKCKGCTLCAKKCPTQAISGAAKQKHVIDQKSCISCGACYTVCRFDAVLTN
jgi:NADH:ubiquinone oxidoreductase subunit F (NADH-binding)/Pyruvate/2-oxoacid:ferredoxin oxidoreductase delta subunit/(2Fe-2S) ferredoxin